MQYILAHNNWQKRFIDLTLEVKVRFIISYRKPVNRIRLVWSISNSYRVKWCVLNYEMIYMWINQTFIAITVIVNGFMKADILCLLCVITALCGSKEYIDDSKDMARMIHRLILSKDVSAEFKRLTFIINRSHRQLTIYDFQVSTLFCFLH